MAVASWAHSSGRRGTTGCKCSNVLQFAIREPAPPQNSFCGHSSALCLLFFPFPPLAFSRFHTKTSRLSSNRCSVQLCVASPSIPWTNTASTPSAHRIRLTALLFRGRLGRRPRIRRPEVLLCFRSHTRFLKQQLQEFIGAALELHRRLEAWGAKTGQPVRYAYRGRLAILIQLQALGYVADLRGPQLLHLCADWDDDDLVVVLEEGVWDDAMEKAIFKQAQTDRHGEVSHVLLAKPLTSVHDDDTPAHPASVVHLSTVPIVDLFIDILEEILKDPSPADWEDLCSLAVTQDGLNRRGHEWAGQLGLGNDAWKKRVSAVMDRDGYATLRDKWEPMSRQWWKKKEAVKMMKQAVGPKDEPMYTDEDVDKTFTFVSTLLNLPYGSHARMPPAKR
ncbi:hypothetical protein JCM10213v2_001535 [Rhodosporidiobolus nylandii]